MRLPLSKTISNQELAQVFLFISGVLSLTDTNRFRIRAYQNAASVIEQLPKELHTMFLTDTDFDKLPAIGETLEQKLVELFTTGRIKAFDEYTKDIPDGVWPLFKLHGLGVKKGYVLAKAFNLKDENSALTTLLEKAKAGEVRVLPGFGEKSETELIGLLERMREKSTTMGRIALKDAEEVAVKIIDDLMKCEGVEKAEALCSLRRPAPTVGDIDIGLICDDLGLVKTCVKNMKNVKQVFLEGEQIIRAELQNGRQVDFKTVPANEWGSFLQHYTGSKEHNIRLREFALKQGKSLSEHGIKTKDKAGNEIMLKFDSEEAFYNALGLAWIPPEDRLGGDEIIKAQKAATKA
jgi:DNA polymerase (family X)